MRLSKGSPRDSTGYLQGQQRGTTGSGILSALVIARAEGFYAFFGVRFRSSSVTGIARLSLPEPALKWKPTIDPLTLT